MRQYMPVYRTGTSFCSWISYRHLSIYRLIYPFIFFQLSGGIYPCFAFKKYTGTSKFLFRALHTGHYCLSNSDSPVFISFQFVLNRHLTEKRLLQKHQYSYIITISAGNGPVYHTRSFCSWISYRHLPIHTISIHLFFPFFWRYILVSLLSIPVLLNFNFEHWLILKISLWRTVAVRNQRPTLGRPT
jgi:hypothetical protein